eukprot:469450-Hanusia_phi.AAC.1
MHSQAVAEQSKEADLCLHHRAIYQTASKICEELNFESLFLKTKQESSLRIQRMVRGHFARNFCQRRKSVGILQKHVKRLPALVDMRSKKKAALSLRASFVRFFALRSFREVREGLESSISIIQRRIIARAMQERYSKLVSLKIDAVAILSRRLQRNRCQSSYQQLLQQRMRAGNMLLAAMRRLQAQKEYAYLRLDDSFGESFSSKISSILHELNVCEG